MITELWLHRGGPGYTEESWLHRGIMITQRGLEGVITRQAVMVQTKEPNNIKGP